MADLVFKISTGVDIRTESIIGQFTLEVELATWIVLKFWLTWRSVYILSSQIWKWNQITYLMKTDAQPIQIPDISRTKNNKKIAMSYVYNRFLRKN